MALRSELHGFFGESESRRVILVGIGNPLRRDDGVGLRVVELLEDKNLRNVLLLRTETVPESYTGAIREYSPTHILLIDAANFDGKPGEGRIIPTKMIANLSLSTHSLPLNIFVDYVRKSICDNVKLLCIQGVEVGFGEGFTPDVEEGAKNIAELLYELLKQHAPTLF